MSNQPETLTYNDELTDDDPIVVIGVSRYWLDYLVAVAAILKESSIWDSSEDVALAVRQADDLTVRLMGTLDGGGLMAIQNPITIRATAMYWVDACTPVADYVKADAYTSSFVKTNTDNNELTCTEFNVPLGVGDYVLTLHVSKQSNCGKVTVYSDHVGTIIDEYDTYDAAPILHAKTSGSFENDQVRVVRFFIIRELKNPSSSGGMIRIQAVDIRLQHGEE